LHLRYQIVAVFKEAVMTEQFKAGDVVQLKSGGPHMTIDKLHPWQGVTEANCDWFEGTKQCHGSFPLTSLRAVAEEGGGRSAAEAGLSGGGPHSWMR
jgi:uncharacterized protein YodC (DUF2158 family)